ncbi:MAG: hypothetical protein ABIH51_00700 [Patescibacteria group bacterium]
MKKFLIIPLIILGLMIFSPVFAQEKLEINFFYSETCPHCKTEQKFLDKIENEYDIVINKYIHTENQKLLIDLLTKHNSEQYIGLVPLTFIGNDFIPGFDNENSIGEEIRNSIEAQLEEKEPEKKEKSLNLPIIGKINLEKYSLLSQAVILGFFDGFNVCSLGALILILGLVLILRSRAKILLFGGTFILITAIVYGLLIVLWYQLFFFLAPVLKIMNIFIGLLGIGGGIYFLRKFFQYKKHGPTCDMKENKLVGKFSLKVQKSFKESGGIIGILISIFIFAVVITIVEFPCSAIIPVFFASTLANAQLSSFSYLLYIGIFVLFYTIDEIIIFLIALFTMNIKIASGKAMIWLVLIEAIVLFGLGFWYLIGF